MDDQRRPSEKRIERVAHVYNFIELNITYPKDPHPPPNIDLLIDEPLSYKTLSFMDAYVG